MQSLQELYRIGFGPSSSHTIGVGLGAMSFAKQFPQADEFSVVLYGSLADTGIGHGTDRVLRETLAPKKVEITFDHKNKNIKHANTFCITAFKLGKELKKEFFYSLGGGAIRNESGSIRPVSLYNLSTFDGIKKWCISNNKRVCEFVFETEDVKEFLQTVWTQMKQTIENGLNAEGELPGGLRVNREAKELYMNAHKIQGNYENSVVSAYAFACAEENAGGGRIVTAPTCGACGVLPAVLKWAQETHEYSDDQMVEALATAGIVGNLIKTNASISGAECGCQAEIGTACCMAAAGYAELLGYDTVIIERAAEIAMEHFLGLTCDPISGLVQIPCIERNAIAARRAIDAVRLAVSVSDKRKISFDLVVDIMYETGIAIHDNFRETSKGGLAKLYSA